MKYLAIAVANAAMFLILLAACVQCQGQESDGAKLARAEQARVGGETVTRQSAQVGSERTQSTIAMPSHGGKRRKLAVFAAMVGAGVAIAILAPRATADSSAHYQHILTPSQR